MLALPEVIHKQLFNERLISFFVLFFFTRLGLNMVLFLIF